MYSSRSGRSINVLLTLRGDIRLLWVLDFLVAEIRHLWVSINIVLGTKDACVPLGHYILGNRRVHFAFVLKLGHSVQYKTVDALNVVHRRIGADGHDELSTVPCALLDVIPVEVNYVVSARLIKRLVQKIFTPGSG